MAEYLPSAHYRNIIINKYNRAPIDKEEATGKQYEDLEFIRSKMYESGEATYLLSSQREILRKLRLGKSILTQKINMGN